jgi:hypothetical protein
MITIDRTANHVQKVYEIPKCIEGERLEGKWPESQDGSFSARDYNWATTRGKLLICRTVL